MLERYYDTVPRASADVEQVGPFTLFVSRVWHPFYARPALGTTTYAAADVEALLRRQDELGVPRSIEWVHETTPELLAAAESVGVTVQQVPLLVLDGDPVSRPVDVEVRVLASDDPDLPRVSAAVHVGFAHAGTATGDAGTAARDAVPSRPDRDDWQRARITAGQTVLVGAIDPAVGPVGGGSHSPRGQVTEIVGVAVLPAFRRRGLAAAITATLARDALDRGVTTVFCSAQSDDVARVYEGVGFRRVGTACLAEAP